MYIYIRTHKYIHTCIHIHIHITESKYASMAGYSKFKKSTVDRIDRDMLGIKPLYMYMNKKCIDEYTYKYEYEHTY